MCLCISLQNLEEALATFPQPCHLDHTYDSDSENDLRANMDATCFEETCVDSSTQTDNSDMIILVSTSTQANIVSIQG